MAELTRTPPRPASRPEPAIRTMRTDVSEFLKATKPSLLTLLAEQARWGAESPPAVAPGPGPVRWLLLAGAGGIITAGGIIALLIFRAGQSTPPLPPATPAPSFIFAEATSEKSIEKTRQGLIAVLEDTARSTDPIGTFRRLIIRLSEFEGGQALPSAGELFALLGAAPPPGLIESLSAPPQLFFYRGRSGPRINLILEVRNEARALQSLLTWEPAMQRELELLFLGSPPPATLRPFQDRTYRNLDYRLLTLDPTEDRGLGYLYFPAKRLIIMGTSEEALQLTLKRLFEAR